MLMVAPRDPDDLPDWAIRRIALGYAMAITARGGTPTADVADVLAGAQAIFDYFTADWSEADGQTKH